MIDMKGPGECMSTAGAENADLEAEKAQANAHQ